MNNIYIIIAVIILIVFIFYKSKKSSKVIKKQQTEVLKEPSKETYINTYTEYPIEDDYSIPSTIRSTVPEIKYKQKTKTNNINNMHNIDLLEKPKYSIQKEIIVDDSDDKYYRKFFGNFAENGFDGYGLNSNYNGPITEMDPSSLQYADFDKNDVGYFGTDAQNTHSSLVQDTIKNKYSQLQSQINQKSSPNDIIKEILYYANSMRQNIYKIQYVLEQIRKRNANISNLNDTEFNILLNSWCVASDNTKQQIINDLIDMLDEGFDSQDEDGNPIRVIICPTGVASRLINANIVDNPDASPLKESDLRQEMLATASNIRNYLEQNPKFTSLSESEQFNVFKHKLLQKYKTDYDGVISEEQILKELNSWINDTF